MAVVLIVAGSWVGYQQLSDKHCSGQIKLSVAAATEISPAVDQAAQQWVSDGANVNGTCVAISVNAINPAIEAAAIAREHHVSLTGLGDAPASVAVPDVWLADSSTWLLRLKADAQGFQPTDGSSVAQSPIVLAMPKPVAEIVGWPDNALSWKDALTLFTTSKGINPGIADPTRDATGLAGLLALSQVAPSIPDGQEKAVGALRLLAQSSSALRDDLLQKFPHSANDPNDIASSVGAAPLSEQDVISYDAQKPSVPLAALYLKPLPPPLDYPYAVMPELSPQKLAAAAGLRGRLSTATFKNALASAGLRGPDGTAGAGFNLPIGAPPATPPTKSASAGSAEPGGTAAAGLDAGAINQTIGRWAAITVPGRVLAVFDVSGSMSTPVPTAKNQTRAQVTQQAAVQGLSLFDDKWAVGVWRFSTDLDGTRPWQEIVPISSLASSRQKLKDSVKYLTPTHGDTGLYDTALAAYKEVRDSWVGGRINSVIMFTDGKNENPGGLTLQQLVTQLKKLNDPERPVRMVIIGIGDQVDPKELQAITDATSAGGVFVAQDPAKINDIFLEAIATRSGAAG
jgi:hypothetical protein